MVYEGRDATADLKVFGSQLSSQSDLTGKDETGGF